jgi:FMN phosphatase YigB (HAD superfamily)
MKKITLAFDCDGTLVTTDSAETKHIVANERIRSMLITFASFKNVRIVVWSGGGELWARQVGAALGIDKYVDVYATKNHIDDNGRHVFSPDIVADIAIDDMHDTLLGTFNLIVREK